PERPLSTRARTRHALRCFRRDGWKRTCETCGAGPPRRASLPGPAGGLSPMRIVLVGNFNEKRAGANFYATVRKLANGFVRNGHQVMSFSDRDVAREASKWGIGRAGDSHANERLIELCANFRPDLLVLFHADKIANETVRELRRRLPALRVCVVNIDALFLPENVARIHRFAEVADMTFITTAGERL